MLSADDFLSVKEAAAILNVSYGSVLAAIHAGSLVAYNFGPRGGTYRVRRGDLTGLYCCVSYPAKPKPPEGETNRLHLPEARWRATAAGLA